MRVAFVSLLWVTAMSQAYAACPDDSIQIQITTDFSPSQTSWALRNQHTKQVVASSGSYAINTTYNINVCISSDSCYEFEIFDAGGNGFTSGGYTIRYHGNVVASGGSFAYRETVSNLGFCPVIPCHGTEIRVVLNTDSKAQETTWYLLNQNTNAVLAVGGNLSNSTTYDTTLCLDSTQCYYFEIFDSNNDGICCGFGSGSFQVYENGSLVGSGSNFGASTRVTGMGSSSCSTASPPPPVISTSTSTYTTSQLVRDVLLGPCVTATNISYTGASGAIGSFTNGQSMGLDSGVILTSGSVALAPGPNNSASRGLNNGRGGDANLNAEFGVSSQDAAVLEFDFTAKTTSVTFDYVFASEEYPEYVCSGFNDAFGFFVSGPGYAGSVNVALAPGSNIPVAINTVNSGAAGSQAQAGQCQSLAYSQYYVDNGGGVYTQYDGYTVPLTATIATQPCSTYHIKLVVADVGDGLYDSSVLLAGESFTGGDDINVTAVGSNGKSSFENCQTGRFVFTNNSGPSNDTIIIPYTISGTATSGSDYVPIVDSFILLPGVVSDTLDVTLLGDVITEGTETIIISLDNVCQCNVTIADTLFILDNNLMVASIPPVDTICQGQSAIIQAIGSGSASTPYSYLWSTGSTTDTIHVSPAASSTYYVTITDACQGQADVDSVTLTVVPAINPGFAVNDSLQCLQGNSFVFTNTGTHGAGATFHWTFDDGASAFTENATHAYTSAGLFNVTLRNTYQGCTDSITRTMIVRDPQLSAVPTHTSCYNTSDGSINLTPIGGTPAYTYAWSHGPATQDVSGLASGTYTVTVTDSEGCIDSLQVGITSPDSLDLSVTATNPSCANGTNGAIDLSVSGGTTLYAYAWNDGPVTEDRAGLSEGAYRVVVTDANGCVDSIDVSLLAPAALSLSASVTDVQCFGDSTGAIDVTISGGTSGYTFQWNDGPTTEDRNNLKSGTYSVTTTDAQGCRDTLDAMVAQNVTISSSLAITHIDCYGDSTGMINAMASGGQPPYRYLWSTGDTTTGISNRPAGAYNLTITDSFGCAGQHQGSITQPQPLTINPLVQHVACFGGSDGRILTAATGGSGPITYLWSTGSQLSGIAGLPIGMYSLTLTDSLHCELIDSFQVTQPTPLALSILASHIDCHGDSTGQIDVTVSGGNPGYSYLWTDGVTTEDRSNLAADTYAITMTDANGCQDSIGVQLLESDSIRLQLTSVPASCFGITDGSINSTVAGGVGTFSYLWNDGPITANRNAIPAGTYQLQVTDSLQCTQSATAVVTQPDAIQVTVTSSDPSCHGDADGSIQLQVIGGTPGYAYQWHDGATTAQRSGLGAGSYRATVTDTMGCIDSTSTIQLTDPTIFEVNGNSKDISCHGAMDGTIDLTTSGGRTPYTFLWNDGDTTEDRSVLDTGTYTVFAFDSSACSDSLTLIIRQPPPLVLSAAASKIACFGDQDGSIDLTISGGVGPFDVLWSTGDTTEDLSLKGSGIYNATVTDSQGCVNTVFVVLPENPDISLSLSTTDIDCYNHSTGTIQVTSQGGAGQHHFLWHDGDTLASRQQLAAGLYRLTVTDSVGCQDSAEAQLYQSDSLGIAVSITDPSCNGGSDGSIDITIQGGVPPYSYQWSDGPTTEDRQGLAAGTYGLTVTDSLGCKDSVTAELNEPPALSITETHTDVSCWGAGDGSILIAVSGGVPGYTFVWNDGPVTQNRNNLVPMTYVLHVIDAQGCDTSIAVTITEPDVILIQGTATGTNCHGEQNGEIQVQVNGGLPPYTYLWHDGDTTSSRDSLPAGTYFLTVEDTAGCPGYSVFVVNEPDPLSLQPIISDVQCFGAADGSVVINVSGGTPGYGYLWNDGPTSASRNGLQPGGYQVMVVDTNGCVDSVAMTINEPGPLMVTGTAQDLQCYNDGSGSINLSVVGGTPGYSYLWSDQATSQDRSNLPSGQYAVTVTDQNNCAFDTSFVLNQPLQLNVFSTVTGIRCPGNADGKIRVRAEGGIPPYQFAWNTGSIADSIDSLPAGNYRVTISDSVGCSQVRSFSLGNPIPLNVQGQAFPVSCFGGSNGQINVAFTKGGSFPYTFAWSDGGTGDFRSNLTAGNYRVTATDSKGCRDSAAFVITQPTALVVSESHIDITCHGNSSGSIAVTASGGQTPYSYTWAHGPSSATLNGLPADTYSVIIRDNRGCADTLGIRLTEPPALSYSVSSENISCAGANDGQINIDVHTAGNFTYQWADGPQTQDRQQLAPGSYAVSIRDSIGCITAVIRSITQPDSLRLNANVTDVSCAGLNDGTIGLSIAGGRLPYVILWSDASPDSANRSGLDAGTYGITVTDSSGCMDSLALTITEPQTLSLQATSTDISCFGAADGSIQAGAFGGNPGYSFLWSDSSIGASRSNLEPGTYGLTITDMNGCARDTSVTLNQPDSLMLELFPSHVSCFGEADGMITTNVGGGSPPYAYQWSNQSDSSMLANLIAGSYALVVTDANGCIITDNVLITQPAEIIAEAGPNQTIRPGELAFIDAEVLPGGNYTYSWQPKTALDTTFYLTPWASPEQSTTYTLSAVSLVTGCAASDTVRIFVFDRELIFVPSAFTPNGDGKNDVFTIVAEEGYDLRNLQIFNRWGQLIHEGSSPWDGTYQGIAQPMEVYVFYLEVRHRESGLAAYLHGNVTLIR